MTHLTMCRTRSSAIKERTSFFSWLLAPNGIQTVTAFSYIFGQLCYATSCRQYPVCLSAVELAHYPHSDGGIADILVSLTAGNAMNVHPVFTSIFRLLRNVLL